MSASWPCVLHYWSLSAGGGQEREAANLGLVEPLGSRSVTATRNTRLVPTGYCFCGCGGEAEIGRWFVQGHDITAAAALRAVEGLRLPHRLVEAGYGPEHSVVQAAVEQAGWKRCPGCAYAGAPDGLAAHLRAGSCATGAPAAQPEPPAESAVPEPRRQPEDGTEQAGPEPESAAGEEVPAAGPGPVKGRPARSGAGGEDTGPVPAEAGPAQGLLLPGSADGVWKLVPLGLRQDLANAAHRLVTPEQATLREKGNRAVRYALRAADNRRMTGKHWHALLTAPRESFGSARSERAQRVFEVLEQVVAQYLVPATEAVPAAVAEGEAAAAPAG